MFQRVFLHCPWRKRTLQIVTNTKSERVWGCVNAHAKGNLHIYDATTNTEKYIQVTEQHTLPSRWCFSEMPLQDNPMPHRIRFTAWLQGKCAWVLNRPPYSPNQSPIKMCSVLWNIKYNIRLQTVLNLIMSKRICKSLHCVAIYILHNFPPFVGNWDCNLELMEIILKLIIQIIALLRM